MFRPAESALVFRVLRKMGSDFFKQTPPQPLRKSKISMHLLKTINPEKVDENNISDWQYRKAVRAVVFDGENKIGLLNVSSKNYFKLPGGGIEEGEDIKIALDRECEEELGVQVEILKEIGSIIEYRAQFKLHQTSYCFIAKTSSDKNAPNFT